MTVTEEQAEPRLIAREDNASTRWSALAILLIGAFLPVLDFTIVNLALPSIRQSLGASSSEVQFVISAYAATYAVTLITGGRLGDLYGRKAMFVAGVAGFTFASVWCGCAHSPLQLILGRILQALMASVMAPQVLASIRGLFTGKELTQALALYGATFGMANICGWLLGGFLVSMHPFGLTWRAIFFVNVPIGVIACIGGIRFIKESRAVHARRLDVTGLCLLSIVLVCLVYPLIEGREAGWPRWMWGMLAVSLVALILFLRYEQQLSRTDQDPLVDVSLFRDRRFSIGLVMSLVFYMISAFYLTFSIYLQGGLHQTPAQAGIAVLPFTICFLLGSLMSSYLSRVLKNMR